MVLKTGLKNEDLRTEPVAVAKHTISRVGFTQASAPVNWKNLWYFSYSCLFKQEVDFKFLTFMFIITFIAL